MKKLTTTVILFTSIFSVTGLAAETANLTDAQELARCQGGEYDHCITAYGDDDPIDRKTLEAALEKACRDGHAASCGRAGTMLVTRNKTREAGEWYLYLACSLNDLNSCSELYSNTRPAFRERLGNQWKSACDSGDLRACGRFGFLYLPTLNRQGAKHVSIDDAVSNGVKRREDGFDWWRLDDDPDNICEDIIGVRTPPGLHLVTGDLPKGIGEAPGGDSTVLAALRQICDVCEKSACDKLADVFRALGDWVMEDAARRQLCSANDVSGCLVYSRRLIQMGNTAEAKQALRRGCNGGDFDSCREFVEYSLESGSAAMMNEYTNLCRKGDLWSCLSLAESNDDKYQQQGLKALEARCEIGLAEACWQWGNAQDESETRQDALDAWMAACRLDPSYCWRLSTEDEYYNSCLDDPHTCEDWVDTKEFKQAFAVAELGTKGGFDDSAPFLKDLMQAKYHHTSHSMTPAEDSAALAEIDGLCEKMCQSGGSACSDLVIRKLDFEESWTDEEHFRALTDATAYFQEMIAWDDFGNFECVCDSLYGGAGLRPAGAKEKLNDIAMMGCFVEGIDDTEFLAGPAKCCDALASNLYWSARRIDEKGEDFDDTKWVLKNQMYSEALKIYQYARRRGFAEFSIFSGSCETRNNTASDFWIRKACDANNGSACDDVAEKLTENGHAGEAVGFYRKACCLDAQFGCEELLESAQILNRPADKELALRRMCRNNDLASCEALRGYLGDAGRFSEAEIVDNFMLKNCVSQCDKDPEKCLACGAILAGRPPKDETLNEMNGFCDAGWIDDKGGLGRGADNHRSQKCLAATVGSTGNSLPVRMTMVAILIGILALVSLVKFKRRKHD